MKTPGRWAKLRTLSGGNQQKLLLARELAGEPRLIVAVHPTRGVDVGATEAIHEALREQRARGAATLLISEDLDELLALSDRIAVLFDGRVMGISARPRGRPGGDRSADGGRREPGVGRRRAMASRLAGSSTPSRRLRIERVPAPSRWATALVTGPVIPARAHRSAGSFSSWPARTRSRSTGSMLAGAFGDRNGVAETLVKTTPLLLAGLGVAVAFRMQLWNIGAEGQLYWGAIFATGVGSLRDPRRPRLGDGAGDGRRRPARRRAVGVDPGRAAGLVRGQRDHHLADAQLRRHPLQRVPGPRPVAGPAGVRLPRHAILARRGLACPTGARPASTSGCSSGSIAALVLWIVLRRTRWGYEIGVMGENPRAALYAGMPTKRTILLVMALSGALAGLAGMSEVAGIGHQLQRNLSPGYGYAAIIVAWLGRLHPFGAVLVAFLLAALTVGGDQIQMSLGLPAAIAPMLQGTILFFLLGGDILTRYRIRG